MAQKRKKIFVDSAVQGTLIRKIGVHWVLFFVVVVGLQVYVTWMSDPVVGLGELLVATLRNNGLFLAAMLLLLPGFLYDSVKLSHRFAGPMVRLKAAMEESARTGELQQIEFRDKDFWLDIAKSYNNMVCKLQDKKRETTESESAA
ncbi:MAG: hypothetical protein VX768_04615 [Planctomycetota bacterium]|nr:hypothetical protein [Planctomycetota bacterium]